MSLLRSIAISFSMFSRLPMPRVEWNEKNMRYMMAFFPLVGVAVGAAVWLWQLLCGVLAFGPVLCGAGLALVPVLVTGGVHLDGFCDTTDALASHAPVEKKQEILKDPHAGAFAIIALAAYLLLYAALGAEFLSSGGDKPAGGTMPAFALVFVLARALSGLGVVCIPRARQNGLAHTFADASAKTTAVALGAVALLAAAGMVALGGFAGAAALVAALVCALVYRHTALRQFGGVSGDVSGWFLQICEISCLGAMVVGGCILQYMPWN